MPSSVSQILGARAAPLTLEHRGRVFTGQHLTQQVKSAFERWLIGRAYAAHRPLKEVDPVLFGQRCQEVADLAQKGYFSFHDTYAREIAQTPDGALSLTGLLFGCTEDEALYLLAERRAEATALLDLLIRESLPDVPATESGEEEPDPNLSGTASHPLPS